MARLSGFPELLPAERQAELVVLDSLRRTFELHGFANIETRAVETLETLLRKGDIDKEVYGLSRLADDADQTGQAQTRPDKRLALHFDLTVPFARYVVDNAGKLDFPFRRYQIQKVWRGERPQQGRFREFTQADIDIVGDGTLPFHADVEIARVMAEALSALPVPPLTLQVSNRKVLEGFYLGLGLADPTAVMQVVDKLDKVTPEEIGSLLRQQGLTDAQAAACLDLAQISSPDTSFVGAVRALAEKHDAAHDLLDEGLDELAAVIEACSTIGGNVTVVADLRIARGLDYYTGTVFETRMSGHDHLGSICSGGRYDALASDGRRTFPGVGISLGVSRLLVPLIADGLVADRGVPSVVLVAVVDEESRVESDALAGRLRSRGIACEVSASAQRFGKQIARAERRGIPYVAFPASDDRPAQIRDIRAGEQVDLDPDTWTPPDQDLRPRIVTTRTEETAP